MIGSIYGCLSGVNCYSIDKCFRKTPEPVTSGDTNVDLKVLVVVISIMILTVCMSTCVLCIVSRIRSVFEELVTTKSQPDLYFSQVNQYNNQQQQRQGYTPPSSNRIGNKFIELEPLNPNRNSNKYGILTKSKKARSKSLNDEEELFAYDTSLLSNDSLQDDENASNENLQSLRANNNGESENSPEVTINGRRQLSPTVEVDSESIDPRSVSPPPPITLSQTQLTANNNPAADVRETAATTKAASNITCL